MNPKPKGVDIFRRTLTVSLDTIYGYSNIYSKINDAYSGTSERCD